MKELLIFVDLRCDWRFKEMNEEISSRAECAKRQYLWRKSYREQANEDCYYEVDTSDEDEIFWNVVIFGYSF